MATTLTSDPPPDRNHGVSLMRIGPAQCRFIISEPANKPTFAERPRMDAAGALGIEE